MQRTQRRTDNRDCVHVATTFAILWAVVVVAGWGVAAPARAEPSAPDLSGYEQVASDRFVVTDRVGNETAYFRTPSGLQCAMRNLQAGCDGVLPAQPAEVTQLVIVNGRGLWATSKPLFATTSSNPAPILGDGDKLVAEGFECAVGGGSTSCIEANAANPPKNPQWFTVSRQFTGIGPANDDLPSTFPDPNAFINDDDTHLVKVVSGAKGLPASKSGYPIFGVGRGITCVAGLFFGDVHCDGSFPGVSADMNQLVLFYTASLGHTDAPLRQQLANPDELTRLPAGHQFHGCLALTDGVACYKGPHGFLVTADHTTTF